MEYITAQELIQLKEAGIELEIAPPPPQKVEEPKGPSIEDLLQEINKSLKALAKKPKVDDGIAQAIQSTSLVLKAVVEKLDTLQAIKMPKIPKMPTPPEPAKAWSIKVERDDDLLITNLKLRRTK